MIRIPDRLASVYGAEVQVSYWPTTEPSPACELHTEHPVPPGPVEFITDGLLLHICQAEQCMALAFDQAMDEWADSHAVNRSVRLEVSIPTATGAGTRSAA